MEGNNMDKLVLGGHEFNSRLLVGTGKYGSNNILPEVIKESGSEIITMALRRVDLDNKQENILTYGMWRFYKNRSNIRY